MSGKGRGRGRGCVKAADYKGPLRKPGETRPAQDGGDNLKEASVSDISQDDVSKPGVEEKHLSEERPEVKDEKPANGPKTVTKEAVEGKEESQTTDTDQEMHSSRDTASVHRTPEKTPLSIEAPEFVPTWVRNSASQGSTSVLLDAVNAPVFVPRRRIPPLLRRRSSKAEDALVNTVKDVLLNLTESPGEFDEQLLTLSHTWSIRPCDENSLQEIVDLIFEQSVLEPNFRYTGSKLAHYLSSQQGNLPGGENFRSFFLTRCRQEHLKKDELLSNPDSLHRAHGFALFLGELFCNFKINELPVLVLLKGLLEILDTLAKQCSDDGISCVGRILKMTGYLIDDDSYVYKDFETTSEKVNNLFKRIETAVQDSTDLKRGTKELLKKVLELRASKWGRMATDNTTSPNVVYTTPAATADIPVAYLEKEDPAAAEYLNDYYNDMASPLHEDYLAPVTNPDHWSEFDDYTDSSDDAYYSYYFPGQHDSQDYAGSSYDDDDVDQEFEKFLAEQGYQGEV